MEKRIEREEELEEGEGKGRVGEEMKSEGGREGEGGITDVITLVLPTSYS